MSDVYNSKISRIITHNIFATISEHLTTFWRGIFVPDEKRTHIFHGESLNFIETDLLRNEERQEKVFSLALKDRFLRGVLDEDGVDVNDSQGPTREHSLALTHSLIFLTIGTVS